MMSNSKFKHFFPNHFEEKILAKSTGETLAQHTNKSLNVLKSIITSNEIFCFLDEQIELFKCLRLGLIFHDFGKIAPGFQSLLLNTKERWNYRHEILSITYFLSLEPNLFSNIKLDNIEINVKYSLYLTFLSLVTNHKTIDYLMENYNTKNSYALERLFTKWQEFFHNTEIIKKFSSVIHSKRKYLRIDNIQFNGLTDNSIESIKNFTINQIPRYYESLVIPWKKFTQKLKLDWSTSILSNSLDLINQNHFTKFVLAILFRGIFLSADHLASANCSEIPVLCHPFTELFHKNHPNWTLKTIQEKCSKMKGDCFLFAPTASGKTESALFWADYNLSTKRGERIFFILPYTASCNKMHSRLMEYFGSENVGILHHKSQQYLFNFYSKSEEDLSNIEILRKVKNTTQLSRSLYIPIKVTTPFQIIKLFFGYKGFEKILVELVGAKCIFDEIHVYDPRTIAQIIVIIKFLKKSIHTQFFIMTATMPTFLQKEFEDVLDNPQILKCPEEKLKTQIKHEFRLIEGSMVNFDAEGRLNPNFLSMIKNDVKNKKSILIVCNSVKTAQFVYLKLIEKKIFGFSKKPNKAEIGLIHGRLTQKDRIAVEEHLQQYNILVGTQAIEVSLDLDFMTGYFEIAPIDALIQRAGRVNRKGKNKSLGKIHIFTQDSLKDKTIYSKERLKRTLELLKEKIQNIRQVYKDENPDFFPLSNADFNNLVQLLYKNGYEEKEQKIFESTKKHFFDFIVTYLRPFTSDKKIFKEFEELFDSIEVLPIQYHKEFKDLIDNRQFLIATNLLVSISKRRLFKYMKEKKIEYDNDYNIYILNVPYQEGFGLTE